MFGGIRVWGLRIKGGSGFRDLGVLGEGIRSKC